LSNHQGYLFLINNSIFSVLNWSENPNLIFGSSNFPSEWIQVGFPLSSLTICNTLQN
jgi:hypothetical protein